MDRIPAILPVSILRSGLKGVLDRLESGEPLVLTQHGRPVAVMLSPDGYNRLVETIEDLALALDAVEARESDQPSTDYEAYLAGRERHVPAPPDK